MPAVSATGRLVGLVLTAAMFAFSSWMYLRSGDWVAAVMAVFSALWALFFLTATARGDGSDSP